MDRQEDYNNTATKMALMTKTKQDVGSMIAELDENEEDHIHSFDDEEYLGIKVYKGNEGMYK